MIGYSFEATHTSQNERKGLSHRLAVDNDFSKNAKQNKEYYYPILCAKRSLISSLVEWVDNMPEWELKLNILKFIGTVSK